MKEYKVIVFQEGALSSIVFGNANVSEVKFTEVLNRNAEQGWRVVTMERDMRRLFLFWKREAFLVVLERERN